MSKAGEKRTVTRRLRSALNFSPGEWPVLLEAWVRLLMTDLALRRRTPDRVRRIALSGEPDNVSPGSEHREALKAVRRLQLIVEAAARNHLYPMTCLRQCLVVQQMLLRRGVRAELRIGARRSEGTLQAHAWLEYEGVPLGEPGDIDSRYMPLAPSR